MKAEESTLLHDKLYGEIKSSLEKNSGSFIKTCQKMINENSGALFSSNPGERVFFAKNIESDMFKYAGVSSEKVGAIIASTKLNDAAWFQRNRPIFTLLFLVQKYFLEKNMKEERKLVIVTLAIIIYAGRQGKFYKFNTGTGFSNVMEYTVNNLSNKFLLKQHDNIYLTIVSIVEGMMITYKNLLSSKKDKDVFTYIMNTVTRIHNFVKKIAQHFYKNRDSGKYINSLKSTDSEDGHLLERENATTLIESLSQNCYTVIKTGNIERNVLTIVCRTNSISSIALKSALEKIYKDEKEDILVLLKSLLTIFFIQEKKTKDDICSPSYLNSVLKIYAQSHTTNDVVITLKKTLEKLLEKNSVEFNKTQRAATKGNFKKALFLYFSLILQRTICGG